MGGTDILGRAGLMGSQELLCIVVHGKQYNIWHIDGTTMGVVFYLIL